ncbi:hypothetical protein Tsubulata_014895, partial [Turnera subulata]
MYFVTTVGVSLSNDFTIRRVMVVLINLPPQDAQENISLRMTALPDTAATTEASHKKAQPTPAAKGSGGSVKSRLKALVHAELARRKGRHRRSPTCPARSRLTRSDPFRHLDTPYEQPPADTRLRGGDPSIPDNATSSTTKNSLELSRPKSFDYKNQEVSGIKLTGNPSHHNSVDEAGKKSIDDLPILQENLEREVQKEIHEDEPITSDQQVENDMDALDMEKTEELLIKILEEPGSPLARYFHNPQGAGGRLRYCKCESFPLRGMSNRRGSRPSRLKQKQEGIDSPEQEGKPKADSETPKSVELKSKNYARSKSMPFISAEGMLKLSNATTASPSSGSVHHLKKRDQNQVAIRRFKDLRQNLKHAVRESKKEKHRIAMDAVLHKIPRGQMPPKDLTRQSFDNVKSHTFARGSKDSARSGDDSDQSLVSPRSSGPRRISRTKSLKESLDKYCQLYECSFNREAKPRSCDTVQPRADNAVSPVSDAPKSITRIFSLPNIDSSSYLSDDSSDSAFSWSYIRSPAHSVLGTRSDSREQKRLFHPLSSEHLWNLDTRTGARFDGFDGSDNLDSERYPLAEEQLGTCSSSDSETEAKPGFIADDFSYLMTKERAFQDEEEFQTLAKSLSELAVPGTFPSPDTGFEDDTATNFSNLGDLEQNLRRLISSTIEPLEDHLAESRTAIPGVTEGGTDGMQYVSNYVTDECQEIQVNPKDRAVFNYVKDVLELSGFTRNEALGTWHSEDHPLDPDLFLELESSPLGPDSSGNMDHLLLFDLINEILLEIFSKTSTYYPKALSSLSRIRPMPVGNRVLKETWTNVSWHLSSTPDPDLLLDHIIGRDLAKSDGWMNLQFDLECEALELEDWIFDDLLDELVKII